VRARHGEQIANTGPPGVALHLHIWYNPGTIEPVAE
jgi:hypothetical protein